MKTMTKNKKAYLLTWLLLPLLLTWFAVAYLVNMNRAIANPQAEVKKIAVEDIIPEQERIKGLVWEGEPLITFWFDDAWKTEYTDGFRILEANGYKGALAVPTQLLEYDMYMTWPQVKQVRYKGWEITSHARNHNCNVKDYENDSFAKSEIEGSLKDFEKNGIKPAYFVTPCGLNGETILKYAKKNYLARRGTGQGVNPLPIPDDYLYDLRVRAVRSDTTHEDIKNWIEEAEEQNAWLIIMFHQVDTSKQEYAASPDMIQVIVDEVKKSGIKVVLPSEVIGMDVKETNEKE